MRAMGSARERYTHPVNPETVHPALVAGECPIFHIPSPKDSAGAVAKGRDGSTYLFWRNTSTNNVESAREFLEAKRPQLLDRRERRSAVLGVGILSSKVEGVELDHNQIGIWVRLKRKTPLIHLKSVPQLI